MIRMPEQFLPYPAFGWETEMRLEASFEQCRGIPNFAPDQEYIDLVPFQNWMKIAAYVPVINVIVGIARVSFFSLAVNTLSKSVARSDSERKEKETVCFVYAMQIVRGLAEILTGPLLIVIDAIKTLYDYVVAKEFLEQRTSP